MVVKTAEDLRALVNRILLPREPVSATRAELPIIWWRQTWPALTHTGFIISADT